jgi:hypothetical protein
MSIQAPRPAKELRIAWWNCFDFYHYDPSKISSAKGNQSSRWPSTRIEYEEKLTRIGNALLEMVALAGGLDILCLCEITSLAAHDLGKRILPNHTIASLDVLGKDLHIAMFFPKNDGFFEFEELMPLVVPNLSKDSRSMGVLDIKYESKTIRVVSCHWTARMNKGSETLRERAGDHLGMHCYEFIQGDPGNHHIIIMGDFNDEPFDSSLERLNTHRHRTRSVSPMHWADHFVKRLHLYNTSWRLMGEKHGHLTATNSSQLQDAAGTYYSEGEKKWLHLDHLIVSGNLLKGTPPYVDENQIQIVSSKSFLANGLPLKFRKDKLGYFGLSDHLPITAIISI